MPSRHTPAQPRRLTRHDPEPLHRPPAAGDGLGGREEWLAAAAFVGLASLSVLGSVVLCLAATATAARVLGRLKAFMVRNNAAIMAGLFLFFGVKLLVDGVRGLVG